MTATNNLKVTSELVSSQNVPRFFDPDKQLNGSSSTEGPSPSPRGFATAYAPTADALIADTPTADARTAYAPIADVSTAARPGPDDPGVSSSDAGRRASMFARNGGEAKKSQYNERMTSKEVTQLLRICLQRADMFRAPSTQMKWWSTVAMEMSLLRCKESQRGDVMMPTAKRRVEQAMSRRQADIQLNRKTEEPDDYLEALDALIAYVEKLDNGTIHGIRNKGVADEELDQIYHKARLEKQTLEKTRPPGSPTEASPAPTSTPVSAQLQSSALITTSANSAPHAQANSPSTDPAPAPHHKPASTPTSGPPIRFLPINSAIVPKLAPRFPSSQPAPTAPPRPPIAPVPYPPPGPSSMPPAYPYHYSYTHHPPPHFPPPPPPPPPPYFPPHPGQAYAGAPRPSGFQGPEPAGHSAHAPITVQDRSPAQEPVQPARGLIQDHRSQVSPTDVRPQKRRRTDSGDESSPNAQLEATMSKWTSTMDAMKDMATELYLWRKDQREREQKAAATGNSITAELARAADTDDNVNRSSSNPPVRSSGNSDNSPVSLRDSLLRDEVETLKMNVAEQRKHRELAEIQLQDYKALAESLQEELTQLKDVIDSMKEKEDERDKKMSKIIDYLRQHKTAASQ